MSSPTLRTNEFAASGSGDVVDGARNRHLMCQDGSVERTNESTIHQEDDYHDKDNWPRHREDQFSRLILSLSKDMALTMKATVSLRRR